MRKFHKSVSGYRSCFSGEDDNKSVLSVHAMEHHSDSLSIDNYKFAILRACNPRSLNREEFKFIDKFRATCLGLNRCKVEK